MKSPLLKTLAAVMLGGLMFLCGWFLRNGGQERPKEDVSEESKPRPWPGEGPLALGPDGYYWGVAGNAEDFPGYIYKMKADGSDWQIVHTFRPEGSPPETNRPQSAVVFDGVDSMLGTTRASRNSAGKGTLYKVNVKTGVLTTLVEFTGREGPHLGTEPFAPLVPDGLGSFWGSTLGGGTNDMGTLFKYYPATGVLTTVVEMPKSTNPKVPAMGPLDALTSDGKGGWWGTSMRGGMENLGILFKVKADTGELTIVFEFTDKHDGWEPNGRLVSDGRGFLWGVCHRGGLGFGTVFKVHATTGALTTVVEFSGDTVGDRGEAPWTTLVDDGQGFLWGSTAAGGSSDGGTLFKIDIATGLLATLVEFDKTESRQKGYQPGGALVNDGHGAFLGTTAGGGKKDAGTIFKIDVKTGVLTTLVEFGKVGP